MRKSNPNKQRIIDYVAREIEQHYNNKIDSFTTTKELSKRYEYSEASIRNYLSKTSIPTRDLKYRSKHLKSKAYSGRTFSKETRRKISEAHYGKILSEEHKRKISKSLFGKKTSEETKRKISEANFGKKRSKETRRKISEALSGKTLPEETKRKMSEAHSRKKHYLKGKTLPKETKRKISKSLSGRKGRSGEKHHNWKGGISNISYSQLFYLVLKEYIRERDDYTCQFCNIAQNGERLSVHHIDHNKENDSEFNLISLCRNCHNSETGSYGNLRKEFIEFMELRINEIYEAMGDKKRGELQYLKKRLEKRLAD